MCFCLFVSLVFAPPPALAEQFAKLLVLDTGIVDHLPKSYEDALHALYGGGLPPPPPLTDRPTC